MGRIENVKQQAIQNEYYRRVLATAPHMQVVIMSIPPNGEVGEETHHDTDQVLCLVEGSGKAILDDAELPFETGDVILVPAGTRHNFVATGDRPLKIMTMYAPPQHPEGLVQKGAPPTEQ